MNGIRDGRYIFTEGAWEQLTEFIIAMSQKVLRETTPLEKERVGDLIRLKSYFP